MAKIDVSKSVLFEMIMATYEAYAVKHDGKHIVAIETYGTLWGSLKGRRGFNCSLEHFSVESSARRQRGCVEALTMSRQIKDEIADVFGEGYQYLGSFHSHPYIKSEVATASELRKNRLFDFSDGDHMSEFGESFEVNGKQYSLALVMTIFSMDRADTTKDFKVEPDLYEFSLGNVKLWLKAQVFEHKAESELTDSDKDEMEMYKLKLDELEYDYSQELIPVPIATELCCDFLDNFGTSFEKFGRLDISSRKARYLSRK
ncbi:hypothetical protein [uncultured Shewanella sp.]|uniref:hypothetical protein n=1 Tax=uncultured Shewanella sp. TaxID=173975 RepID=UPI00260D9FEE|nr:hypothetical protein [uncultured Shewanella sp.]